MYKRQVMAIALLIIISVGVNKVYACGGSGGPGPHVPNCDSTPGGSWYCLNYYAIPNFSCPNNCTSITTGQYYDYCATRFFEITCKPTPLYNGGCAYEFWCGIVAHSPSRAGLCVYDCGINWFWIKSNATDDHYLEAFHRTADGYALPIPEDCDEGTIGKLDWQNTHYYYDTDVLQGWCREGTQLDYGESNTSACENQWWQ